MIDNTMSQERCHHCEECGTMCNYYLSKIKQGNIQSMIDLALHYYYVCKNNEGTKKYLQMAIDKKSTKGMCFMACYYEEQNDEENMMKYFRMAIKHKSIDAMICLGCHCEKIDDLDNMIKYLSMAICNDSTSANLYLSYYFEKTYSPYHAAKYFSMSIKYKKYKVLYRRLLSYIYYYIKKNNDKAFKYCKEFYMFTGELTKEHKELIKKQERKNMLNNKKFMDVNL